MRLTCPSCAVEYEVEAEKFGPRGRKVRCAACRTEWFQSAEALEEPDPADDAEEPDVEPALEDYPAYRAAQRETPPLEDVDYDVEPDEPPASRAEAAAASVAAVKGGRGAARGRGDERPPRSGGAFLAGFATVALLALVLIAVYAKAPEIAEMAPAAREPLAAYTELVDRGRMMLAEATGGGPTGN